MNYTIMNYELTLGVLAPPYASTAPPYAVSIIALQAITAYRTPPFEFGGKDKKSLEVETS